MASSSMIHSASAASSSSRSYKYDIFLSFRGEDTRKTYVDHLYSSLIQHRLVTYKDDETLPRGASISQSLLEAIEQSRIALVIFSKNYADSSWCLDELAHIMECKKEDGLIVMPIFYDVDPSDVRKQTGDFGKAFAQQEAKNNSRAQVWRDALVDVSQIAGWEPKNITNGHESKGIKEIVDAVLGRLFPPLNTYVDEGLVGMKTRLQDLKSHLEIGAPGVLMVGIWGLGGSGKTTLATTIQTEICDHFQGHYIMENVREESSKLGLKKLQENMLSTFFKSDVEVPSVAQGKHMIKNMFSSRNVLIILDDVNDTDQLDALVGSHSWFGSGSRIIITTRDEHLLRTHKVEKVYYVRLLSDDEGMQLFNKHAYNKNNPVEDYETLSLRVVSYAAGLPLALKVLGLFLYDKEKEEWMSALDRLKDIPETKIVDKLKVSYNGLKDVEKELFLDIACFWRGAMKDDAMEALEACGFHPTIGIEVLRQKALLTVTKKGKFDMHDLIQEMGHYIVRGEHPNNPENHSRVWKRSEIRNMCVGDATTENNMIQAIKFTRNDDHNDDGGVEWTQSELCKLVSTMKKLRYLDVGTRSFERVEGPIFLSNDLRYLKWDGYYGRSEFSNTFRPTNLRVLRLKPSFQKQLWKDNMRLPHLKVLELHDMRNLVSTPDFDELPCLQELELSCCKKLKKIHPSLGNHTSLEHVNVSYCSELRRFPTIVRMKNLKTLIIWSCANILEFPEIKADMESLVELSLNSVGLEVLPSSIIERCTNLTFLELSSLDNLKSIEFNLDALEQLKELSVTEVKQPVKTRRPLYHQILGKLGLNTVQGSNSQELSLYHNVYSRLDFSQTHVSQLKVLNLTGCKNLIKLPDLPSSLNILIAGDCESLVTLGDGYKNCIGLCEVALGGSIISDVDTLLEFMLGVCIANNKSCMLLQLMGIEVTKGFLPPFRRGGRCRLELPKNWCNDFSGFLMYGVLKRDTIYGWSRMSLDINTKEMSSGMDYEDDMKEMSNRGMYYYKDDVVWKESDGDEDDVVWKESECSTCVGYVSFASLRETTWWDQTYKALNFSINEGGKFSRKAASGCGVRLVEKKNGTGLKETSTKSSSHYTPRLKIKDDSKSALSISLSPHEQKLVFPDFVDKSFSFFMADFLEQRELQQKDLNIFDF